MTISLGQQNGLLLPSFGILGAWFCFGSFAVPMKHTSVIAADVHPLVFQTYKTGWTFVTAHLVLFAFPYEFTWWGILSGIAWVPAGIAAVYAVKNIGITYGQTVWQVTIIATSCVWGFGILHEKVNDIRWVVFGFTCIVVGLVGMILAMNRNDDAYSVVWDKSKPKPYDSIKVGIGAALFNGIWGGSNLIPASYAPLHGVHFVISFATGALLVNVALWVLYAWAAKRLWKCDLPPMHFRTMAIPGFLSGTLWSAGNFMSLFVVSELGQGIGYSLIQSSIIVAGLWGIIYFREMRKERIFLWALWCCVCLTGVSVLALDKNNALHATS
eukprot:TRINITY_DN35285_c0_g1_i1.p1 TRINITY_DN35285_c0_g1~~TRINITY_DN35285_c0_g1_i1.p1  ORF type:complete len:327 (-),score=36.64 TRINITY_DN35285_c0_g1_i1:532-1512(-)